MGGSAKIRMARDAADDACLLVSSPAPSKWAALGGAFLLQAEVSRDPAWFRLPLCAMKRTNPKLPSGLSDLNRVRPNLQLGAARPGSVQLCWPRPRPCHLAVP